MLGSFIIYKVPRVGEAITREIIMLVRQWGLEKIVSYIKSFINDRAKVGIMEGAPVKIYYAIGKMQSRIYGEISEIRFLSIDGVPPEISIQD